MGSPGEGRGQPQTGQRVPSPLHQRLTPTPLFLQGPLTASPNTFDGHYYTEVVAQTGRRGWFTSDRALNARGAPTASLMQVRAGAGAVYVVLGI